MLQEKLRALEAIFERAIPARMAELSQAFGLCVAGADCTAQLTLIHRQLHTLAGSAGSFGFVALGERARALECLVKEMLRDGADGARLAALGRELHAYTAWCLCTPREAARSAPQPAPTAPPWVGGDGPIILVDNDALLARDMAAQLEVFGYRVLVIGELARLEEALAHSAPAAVIMDMSFGAHEHAGALEITRIRQASALHFPCVFTSGANDFATRLAAVRAGADGYFSKPVDILALAERLDALTVKQQAAPFRILIVDDEQLAVSYYATVLSNAGMQVRALHAPHDIFSALGEFQPELVLMDVYMPECSGIELTKLVRQENQYLDVPIVFLSSEDDLDIQLDAVKSGADDFLTKPVAPAHLISSLTSRAGRHRLLRTLIMRDSLTSLYNHSAIKEQLAREMVRAQRSGSELTLAMIDLDHFKWVNDTYGHPVGDQVIRAFARLLQQRLRRSEIIGRYGGEEFVVILPATAPANALMVLDQVREAFSRLRHQGNEREFSVSFSAGLVAMGTQSSAAAMFNSADAALYKAKQKGRNRIELAGH